MNFRYNFGFCWATFNYIRLFSTLALAYMSTLCWNGLNVSHTLLHLPCCCLFLMLLRCTGVPWLCTVTARKRSKVSARTALSVLNYSDWIINVEIRSFWSSPAVDNRWAYMMTRHQGNERVTTKERRKETAVQETLYTHTQKRSARGVAFAEPVWSDMRI